ncbi:hypothetical protein [Anabaena azotica]|uniref:PAS fold-2 domain-containing protein n=1 Tax=Anabaena azotica FACHB-119 TaxID=947527 RepID=A0ABR8D3P8_9NOST|nr:hypothetical protein [Anabaena azotica]MBD2501797.1 hypothetical protein [Anabaena azotica FACHB-119]
MNTNDITIPFQVDISSCNKEAIHILRLIQPDGVLLALRKVDLTIIQVSNNTFKILCFTALMAIIL